MEKTMIIVEVKTNFSNFILENVGYGATRGT